MKKLFFTLCIALCGLALSAQTADKVSCKKSCSPEMCLGATVDVVNGTLVFTNVKEDGPAHKAGIHVGDQINSVSDASVASVDELNGLLKANEGSESVDFSVMRDGQVISRSISMASPMATVDGGTMDKSSKKACAKSCAKSCAKKKTKS